MLFIFCFLSLVLDTTVPTDDRSFRRRWCSIRMIFSPFFGAINAFLHVELFTLARSPKRLYSEHGLINHATNGATTPHGIQHRKHS